MGVKVLFFGVLTEVTGTACKHYFDVKNLEDLKHRIFDDFPEIGHYNYRIAINNQIVDGDHELRSSDEVAYLPPFAGG
jgi:sulfur-carrier protein